MMRRIVIPTLVLAVLCLCVAEVQAASANNLLFPYSINKLEDDDWESMYDYNNNQILDAGDFLYGMLSIQNVHDEITGVTHWPTYDTFSGEFVFKVGGVVWDVAANQWKYTMVPATATEWAMINTNLGIDLEIPTGSNSFGTMWSDKKAQLTDNWVEYQAPAVTTVKDALDTADTYNTTPLWDIGFTGNKSEFWVAYATSQNVFSPTLSILTYGAVGVTHYYPSGVPLLPHNYLGGLNPVYATIWTGMTEIQAFGALEYTNSGVFDLKTDTDFYIKPTPEPASLALLGLGLLGLGGYAVRRRRNR